MIQIEPNALYTRDDLAVMLKPAGVDVDHFIARVKPRKFLRMVWLGDDILAAMRTAPALAEREDGAGPVVIETLAPVLTMGRGRGGKRGAARPGSKLQAHLKSLKD